jgi:parallel beta-helix repeat protein
MKPKLYPVAIALTISFLLVGCAGSKTDQAARETQVMAAAWTTLTADVASQSAAMITVVETSAPAAADAATSTVPVASPVATEPPASPATQPPSGPSATEPPAPVPQAGQEETLISLKPGGGGDYASLADAIHSAPPGAHILLEPGLYPLEEAITVDRPLMLEGASDQQTIILSATAEHLLQFKGSGPFSATGITFRHEGTEPANVVVVLGGEVDFAFCTFTGGVFSDEASYGGNGLFLGGSTTGRVYSCEAKGNQEQGILLREQAQPSITLSSLHHNGGCGIGYFGQAAGYAGANVASDNALHGICLSDTATPVLEDNTCRRNNYSGIVYYAQSGGEARNNDCSLNGQDGIALQGQAQPLLEGNSCFANGQTDIAYYENAGGTAQANRCSTDAPYGLYVVESASPNLVDNQCPLSGAAVQATEPRAPGPQYNPDGLEGYGPICFNQPPLSIDREWQTSAGTRSIVLGDSVPLSLRSKWGEPGEVYEVMVRVIAPDGTETVAGIKLEADMEAVLMYPDEFAGGSTDSRGAYTVIWEIDGGFVGCDGFVTIGGAS